MLTSSGGGRSMLTVADRGEGGGIKFAKILLTSYVNAPQVNAKKFNKTNTTTFFIENFQNCYQRIYTLSIHSIFENLN